MRKYEFSWELLGDLKEGRPHLGTSVGVDIYRLMHYTLRDVLEDMLDDKQADAIFFRAGKLAGKEFFKQYIAPVSTMDEFVGKVQKALRQKGIGLMRIEEIDRETHRVTLTMDEDLDCSGLPELNYETCIYDEGFLTALFEEFTGERWTAKEIDCWCTGARTCRFLVKGQEAG